MSFNSYTVPVRAMDYKLSSTIHGHTSDVRCISVLPDGSFVSGSRDATAKLWKREGDEFVNSLTFYGHSNFIFSICVLPPTSTYPWGLIVTGSGDHTIRGYVPDDNRTVFVFREHMDAVCDLVPAITAGFLSASWDKTAKLWDTCLKECQVTFRGHSLAVWCILQLPNGSVITGSADCSMKIHTLKGEIIRSIKGHTDCVRALSHLKDLEFLSCANDGTIRHWNFDGNCLNCYSCHPNYIYSVCTTLDGKTIASSGEDNFIYIRSNEYSRHLILPAQSIWTVKFLPNNDLLAGCSDGTIRIFTTDPKRLADEFVIRNYEEEVERVNGAPEIGDFKVSEFPGPEGLLIPGRKEGQVKVIREKSGEAACYKWSASSNNWEKIGAVLGGTRNKKSPVKTLYNGKEYDYVFSVDVEDGKPPLKLPYNSKDDPTQIAQEFLIENNLSVPSYLEQVTDFIVKNTLQSEGITQELCDPLTGSNRYIPMGTSCHNPSSPTKKLEYFPQKNYISFEIGDPGVILKKLEEFNEEMDDKVRIKNVTDVMRRFTKPFNSSYDYSIEIEALRQLLTWPKRCLFPVVDIMRLAVRDKNFNRLICSGELGQYIINLTLDLLKEDSFDANQITTLRLLSNMLLHPFGESVVVIYTSAIVDRLTKLIHINAKKHIQLGISTLLLNLAIAIHQGKCEIEFTIFLTSCNEVLINSNEPEAVFRLLVAVGTLLTNMNNCKVLPASLIQHLSSLKHSNSGQIKIKDCASDILNIIL